MKYSTQDYHNETTEDVIRTGVYTIEFINKPGIYYVGSASKTNMKFGKSNVGFHGRWREHLYMLFNNKHYNRKLQNNFNKYGEKNLFFSIIDFYEPLDCIGAEQYWLNMLDSYGNGYNLSCVVSKSSVGRKMSKQQRKILSDRMMGNKNPNYKRYYTQEERDNISIIMSKSIIQYDFSGNFIKKWFSIIDASEELNIDSGNISKCCNKKQLTYKKFFWFFTEDKIDIKKYIVESLKRKSFAQSNRGQKPTKKPVLQYDKNGNFIKEWKSIKDATQSIGASTGNISKCCNGKQKTCEGFVWRYELHIS